MIKIGNTIHVEENLYTIEVKQNSRIISVYPLDNFKNCNVEIFVNVEET